MGQRELVEHGLESIVIRGNMTQEKARTASFKVSSSLKLWFKPHPFAKEGLSQSTGSFLATTIVLWRHVPKNREGPSQSFQDVASKAATPLR